MVNACCDWASSLLHICLETFCVFSMFTISWPWIRQAHKVAWTYGTTCKCCKVQWAHPWSPRTSEVQGLLKSDGVKLNASFESGHVMLSKSEVTETATAACFIRRTCPCSWRMWGARGKKMWRKCKQSEGTSWQGWRGHCGRGRCCQQKGWRGGCCGQDLRTLSSFAIPSYFRWSIGIHWEIIVWGLDEAVWQPFRTRICPLIIDPVAPTSIMVCINK